MAAAPIGLAGPVRGVGGPMPQPPLGFRPPPGMPSGMPPVGARPPVPPPGFRPPVSFLSVFQRDILTFLDHSHGSSHFFSLSARIKCSHASSRLQTSSRTCHGRVSSSLLHLIFSNPKTLKSHLIHCHHRFPPGPPPPGFRPAYPPGMPPRPPQ